MGECDLGDSRSGIDGDIRNRDGAAFEGVLESSGSGMDDDGEVRSGVFEDVVS